MNKITIYTLYQGCSFGERCNPADFSMNGMNVLAVLTAKKAERPLKLLLTEARSSTGIGRDGELHQVGGEK
jgi:hypothetical protein